MSKSLNKLMSENKHLSMEDLKDGEYYVGAGVTPLAIWNGKLSCFFYLAKTEDGIYFSKPINHVDDEDGTEVNFTPLAPLNISSE